jgi:uncharacterized protein (DUF2235 family)
MSDATPTTDRSRRLVICCDGTWNSEDAGESATNVLRLARMVRAETDAGASQLVYYDNGVGTGNILDRIVGGATGIGLSRNVREAYTFIVNNYADGDEIFLFGFSRGAYTARCVAGLIGRIGILRKRQMGNFAEAWDWNRRDRAARERTAAEFEARFSGRNTNATVRCIGVWDTVGALGIPTSRLPFNPQPCVKSYGFLDAELGPHVEHAFQALAIDERRQPFLPSIWSRSKTVPNQDVRQVWFSGVHSDIGGGYANHGTADIALLWMTEQLRDLLDLDLQRLTHELHETEIGVSSEVHDSFGPTWAIAGDGRRDWRTQATPTNETQFVHRSVHERLALGHYPINPKFEIGALPVWEPSGVEIQYAKEREKRTQGDQAMALHKETFCDRVVKALGGG